MTTVLLHGANSSAAEIEPFAAALRAYGEVFAPNLPGHGGRPIPEAMTLRGHGDDVIAQMDARGIERAALVGYSAGGVVALDLALRFPGRFTAACGLATKVVVDEPTVRFWTYLASLERLEDPGNPRGKQLAATHAPQDWREVARANQRFFAELGRTPLSPEALAACAVPVMLVGGSRDRVAPWPDMLETGRRIRAKLVMFYGNAHPIAAVPAAKVARAFDEWRRGP